MSTLLVRRSTAFVCRSRGLRFSLGIASCLLVLPVSLLGQCDTIRGEFDYNVPSPAVSVALGQKDAPALQEIRDHLRMVGFRNWRALDGRGELTLFKTEVGQKANASVSLLGADHFQLRFNTEDGSESITVTGASGAIRRADGRKEALTPASSVAGPTAFLRIRDLSVLSRPETSLVDRGMVTLDSRTQHRITIAFPILASARDFELAHQEVVIDYYFDPVTHLLSRSTACVTGSDSTSERYLQSIIYGDYRDTGGVVVPHTFQYILNGQRLWSLGISAFTDNSGLNQSIFSF